MSRHLMVYCAILVACAADTDWAVAQPSAASFGKETQVAETSSIDPVAVPSAELKIRIAPLDLNELEALRAQVLEAVHTHATHLADLLVERMRLDEAPDRNADAIARIDETLAGINETKAGLLSRANIILTAIEGKGGDVASGRAYIAAVSALHPEEATPTDEAEELPPEEREEAVLRARVSELIAVVRAEPPVHERSQPWEVPLSELELELQPLTLEEIEKRLQAWQGILEREVRKRIRFDILLNNPDKLAEVRAARAEAALTAGMSQGEAKDISIEALKAELAAQSQAQQQVVRAIVQRMNTTVRLVQLRGGDPKKYIDYIASATGQKLNLYDPTVLYAQVRAWLYSRDGGVGVGLNILKFLATLVAFWFLSIIIGWITSAGVSRIPKTSSLLRPLLVNVVRKTIMVIGLIIAITMLGVSVGPLLAIIGAAGLVVGLALQSTLSNFASGIMILLNHPYDVGDAISAGGVVGKVEAMNLVSTSILTFDNQAILVPNNQIWNGVITNITGRATRRVDMTFSIAYADDVSKSMQILEAMMKAHPKVLPDPAPIVRVSAHGDNSINLIARPWTKTIDYWDVYWDMMRDVKLRFDAEGISIPFPQRDLHVAGPIEVTWAGRT